MHRRATIRAPGGGRAVASQVEVVEGSGSVRDGEALAIGMVAFTVIVWGCVGRVTAEAVPYAEPLTLTALRAAPAALFLLLLLPVLHYRLPATRAEWGVTAVTGLLMVTWFLFGLTESVGRIGPGLAIVLLSTSPFFIVLAERIVFGRRVSRLMLAGIVIGFVGVVIVVSGQIDATGDTVDMIIGMALALSGAAAFSAGTVIVKEELTRRPDTDIVGLTAGQYIVGGAALLVMALIFEGPDAAEWGETGLWVPVAFTSIVASALAVIAYFAALRKLDPANVSSWMFLTPVVAVVLELILGNAPEGIVLLGMAVTIAGVAIVSAAPRIAATSS
jgi:probable blue pigment (indigoidine) exporter